MDRGQLAQAVAGRLLKVGDAAWKGMEYALDAQHVVEAALLVGTVAAFGPAALPLAAAELGVGEAGGFAVRRLHDWCEQHYGKISELVAEIRAEEAGAPASSTPQEPSVAEAPSSSGDPAEPLAQADDAVVTVSTPGEEWRAPTEDLLAIMRGAAVTVDADVRDGLASDGSASEPQPEGWGRFAALWSTLERQPAPAEDTGLVAGSAGTPDTDAQPGEEMTATPAVDPGTAGPDGSGTPEPAPAAGGVDPAGGNRLRYSGYEASMTELALQTNGIDPVAETRTADGSILRVYDVDSALLKSWVPDLPEGVVQVHLHSPTPQTTGMDAATAELVGGYAAGTILTGMTVVPLGDPSEPPPPQANGVADPSTAGSPAGNPSTPATEPSARTKSQPGAAPSDGTTDANPSGEEPGSELVAPLRPGTLGTPADGDPSGSDPEVPAGDAAPGADPDGAFAGDDRALASAPPDARAAEDPGSPADNAAVLGERTAVGPADRPLIAEGPPPDVDGGGDAAGPPAPGGVPEPAVPELVADEIWAAFPDLGLPDPFADDAWPSLPDPFAEDAPPLSPDIAAEGPDLGGVEPGADWGFGAADGGADMGPGGGGSDAGGAGGDAGF